MIIIVFCSFHDLLHDIDRETFTFVNISSNRQICFRVTSTLIFSFDSYYYCNDLNTSIIPVYGVIIIGMGVNVYLSYVAPASYFLPCVIITGGGG